MAATAPSEYQIKAAFLFNFARFVEWPERAFPGPRTPLSICILGEDPFGGELDRMVAGKNVEGHPVDVRRLRREAETAGCHVLFLGAAENDRAPGVLAALGGSPTLTVGEQSAFGDAGGTIAMSLEKSRVAFEVNLAAAGRAGLKISSRLLKLATRVRLTHGTP